MKQKVTELEIVPEGAFGIEFKANHGCGRADPGIHVAWRYGSGDWSGGGVILKEDAIALRDFLSEHIPSCRTLPPFPVKCETE